jgi:von Willebrand factor type A domain
MHRSRAEFVRVLLLFSLVGCGFAPVAPGGAGGMPGNGTGAAGAAGAASMGGAGGTASGGGGQAAASGDVILTGTGGAAGMSCGQATVPIMPLPPDVLIVQDKSGSMAQDATGKACTATGCSKWTQVSTAIETVVSSATGANVNWGLVFFGADNACGVAPNGTATVAIAPAATSAPAIQAAFTATQPQSRTPTEAAMNSAVTYMQTLTDQNPKFILLATDGEPNCPPGGNTTADDSPGAETAVTNAVAAGFKTFVVGIATSNDAMATTTLNTMAINGGEPQPACPAGTAGCTQYYSVTDTASLETALNGIIGLVASCTISLKDAPKGFNNVVISATDATTGNPVAIPQDPVNGWSYDATMANVILNGTSCANLQNLTYTAFNFNYACAGVVICIDEPCPTTN